MTFKTEEEIDAFIKFSKTINAIGLVQVFYVYKYNANVYVYVRDGVYKYRDAINASF